MIEGCVDAVASGVVIDEEKFLIVAGVGLDVLRAVQVAFPHVDDAQQDVALALNGAMGTVGGYPHGRRKRLTDFLPRGADESTVAAERAELDLRGGRVTRDASGAPSGARRCAWASG